MLPWACTEERAPHGGGEQRSPTILGALISKANPTGGLSPGLGGQNPPYFSKLWPLDVLRASSCLSWPQFPDCLRRAGHRTSRPPPWWCGCSVGSQTLGGLGGVHCGMRRAFCPHADQRGPPGAADPRAHGQH